MRIAWIGLALVALAAPSQAGSLSHPEVSDQREDTAPILDLLAMWYDVTDTAVAVHVAVASLPEPTANTTVCQEAGCIGLSLVVAASFRVVPPGAASSVDNQSVLLQYRWAWGQAGAATVAQRNATGALQGELPVAGNLSAGVVVFTMPRNHTYLQIPQGPTPGAFRLNESVATTWLARCRLTVDPVLTAACEPVTGPAGLPGDRAPDAGAGRDYLFAQPLPTHTMTQTATQTVTATVTATSTETQEVLTVLSATATAFPSSISREGLPGPGLLVALALLGLAVLVRRTLP